MKKYIFIGFIAMCLANFIVACDLFAPRTPEAPDNQNTRFIPPTSPEIVVSNFINSIKDLNNSNYIACLDKDKFSFQPSADVFSKYSEIFLKWDINSEKIYFYAMNADNSEKINPKISLLASGFDIMSSDSAVYLSDYKIQCEFIDEAPREFAGKFQMNIVKKSDGLWYIRRWNDFQNPNDSIKFTWSALKAKYSN